MGHVPAAVWTIGIALLTLAAALSARAWRNLPTARGRHAWWRVVTFAVPTLFFGALLCTLAVITAQLP